MPIYLEPSFELDISSHSPSTLIIIHVRVKGPTPILLGSPRRSATRYQHITQDSPSRTSVVGSLGRSPSVG